jgi:hypothetical protein
MARDILDNGHWFENRHVLQCQRPHCNGKDGDIIINQDASYVCTLCGMVLSQVTQVPYCPTYHGIVGAGIAPHSYRPTVLGRTDTYDYTEYMRRMRYRPNTLPEGSLVHKQRVARKRLQKRASGCLSMPYYRGNHFNERCKLFGNCEPRICGRHLDLIRQVYTKMASQLEYDVVFIPKNNKGSKVDVLQSPLPVAGALNKHHIRLILRYIDFTQDPCENDDWELYQYDQLHHACIKDTLKNDRQYTNWTKKYSERWLQIKVHLVGGAYKWQQQKLPEIPDQSLLARLSVNFRVINKAFEEIKDDYPRLFKGRHNIVNLDSVFLHLLINEDNQDFTYYKRYKWYLDPLKNGLPKVLNELRIKRIYNHIYKQTQLPEWEYVSLLNNDDLKLLQ